MYFKVFVHDLKIVKLFILNLFNSLPKNKYLYRNFTLVVIYELIVIAIYKNHYQKMFIKKIVHVTISLLSCHIFQKPCHLSFVDTESGDDT